MPTDWIQVVSSVGFPIAVAAYLLVRMEHILTELRDAIRSLSTQIKILDRTNRE